MAKAATPLFPAPSFKFPEPKLPKLDLDALFTTQKANLAAVQEAQSVLIDAAQAIAKVQHDYLGQSMAAVRASTSPSRSIETAPPLNSGSSGYCFAIASRPATCASVIMPEIASAE